MEIPIGKNKTEKIKQRTMMGAIPWTVYSLLELINNEWERPVLSDVFPGMDNNKPSQKLVIVILFWSLFESLMEKFFEDSMRNLPPRIKKNFL